MINFVINLILIPKYSAVGAAIGTICAEAAVCGYQLYSVRKDFNLVKYLKWEFVFAVFGIIIFFIIGSEFFINYTIKRRKKGGKV